MRRSLLTVSVGLICSAHCFALGPPVTNPTFKTPPDWKAEVIASPPDVKWPSVVEQAPDGRIFIGEHGEDMPGPAGEPIDRILCIFPDGHITVFADKVNAVFALRYIDGKLYVHESPTFAVYTDDNGVGKDKKILIPSTYRRPAGNALNDHIPSGVRLGMDNYLYMSTGDKGIYGATGTDKTAAQIHGGGVMRFRPDGTDLQVYSTGTRNHLDLALNGEDEIFTYDNTDDGQGWWTRYTHMVDGGYYGYPFDYKIPTQPEMVGHDGQKRDTTKPFWPWTLWRIDEFGGGSPCGAVGYNEDALPAEYVGNTFHCEWGKGNFERFAVERDGGSYKIIKREIMLTAPHFRPLGVTVMADGTGFLIADWQQDGWSVPVVTGRLWKLTYTGASHATPRPTWYIPAAMGQEFKATTAELIAGLSHPAEAVRLVAQRRLAERAKQATGPLIGLMQDAKAPPYARWHAIWTLDRIDGGAGQMKEIIALAADPKTEVSVRRQAIRQLGTRGAPEAAEALLPLLKDADASVRFRAATALGRIGDASGVPALLSALDDKDFFTHYAVFVALRRIGTATPAAWPKIAEALKSNDAAVRQGVELAAHETFELPLVDALAGVVKDQSAPAPARAAALSSLAPLHREQPAWDGRWWGTQPAGSPPPPKTVEWSGTPAVLGAIRSGLTDASPEVRKAAIEALQIAPDPQAPQMLVGLFAHETDEGARKAILAALGTSKSAEAVVLAAALLKDPQKNQSLLPAAIAMLQKIDDKPAADALVAFVKASPDQSAPAFAALEHMHSASVAPALAEEIKNPNETVAISAAEVLGKTGDASTGRSLEPGLADPRVNVRRAVVGALGALQARDQVPALLAVYQKDAALRNEAIDALARVPDARALDAYIDGLGGQDAGVRDTCRKAVKSLGDSVLPAIESRLVENGSVSQLSVSELQHIYEGESPIRSWRVIGSFPRAYTSQTTFDKVVGADHLTDAEGKPATWKTVTTNDAHGRVDLNSQFNLRSDVSAYAVAELISKTARQATFTCGSDDGLTVWVNGTKAYEWEGDRAYQYDMVHFNAPLKAGANQIVARITQASGGWEFSVAVSGAREGKLFSYEVSKTSPAAYASFAADHAGNAEAGKAIFHNASGVGCIKCHTIGNEGGIVGPNLSDIAIKYPKAAIIESVLYPSKQIESGYEQTLVRLKNGNIEAGVVRSETADELTLYDSTAKKTVIAKSDIQVRKTSPVSVMPEGLQAGLTQEQFADLIAYLMTLKQPPQGK